MIGCTSRKFSIFTTRYSFALFKQQKWGTDNRDKKVSMHRDKEFNKVLFTEEDAKKIDEVNKYFQGIRYNTSYAKYYNEDSRNQQTNLPSRNIGDLPFHGNSNYIE